MAAPIDGEMLRFVNSPWIIDRSRIAADLALDRLTLLNDFGAVAHAVTMLDEDELAWLAGPQGPLPAQGVTTVLGPGTGLGVAMLLRRSGRTEVIETEGAHIGFAPLNAEEQKLATELAERFGRASAERIVSGPGLHDLYRFFGGRFFEVGDAAALWTSALEGRDSAAEQALELFVKTFGSVAGDLALAHGSNAVVISSGLSQRLAPILRSALFVGRFLAKGRYRQRMERLPVRLAMHPEPGLLGAAVAFTHEHFTSPSQKKGAA